MSAALYLHNPLKKPFGSFNIPTHSSGTTSHKRHIISSRRFLFRRPLALDKEMLHIFHILFSSRFLRLALSARSNCLLPLFYVFSRPFNPTVCLQTLVTFCISSLCHASTTAPNFIHWSNSAAFPTFITFLDFNFINFTVSTTLCNIIPLRNFTPLRYSTPLRNSCTSRDSTTFPTSITLPVVLLSNKNGAGMRRGRMYYKRWSKH